MSTPLPSLPLVEALVAMVETALTADEIPIFLAGAPREQGGRYAVFYPDIGRKSAFHRNVVNDGPNELRYQVTAVGEGPELALRVADKVAEVLLTATPSVPGRRVWPTVQEAAQPVRRDDESTGVWLATSQWLTRSDPA